MGAGRQPLSRRPGRHAACAGRAALVALLLAGGAAIGAAIVSGGGAAARPSELAGHDLDAPAPAGPDRAAGVRLCRLIENAALMHGLPAPFLARLIWKESRFDTRAVSPKGAQGVAQFMPATARRRGLDDPFDPAAAIPASAAYLAELRAAFGNLGLAAAAYNAGEARVESYLARRSGLPGETLDYVHSITFRPAAWFRDDPAREVEPRPLVPKKSFARACAELPVIPTRAVLFEGAAWQPWGVQVAGNRVHGRAMRQFARVQARFGAILGDRAPMVVRGRAGLGRHKVWSVLIGAASRREAIRLCQRLRAAGAPCIVRRN